MVGVCLFLLPQTEFPKDDIRQKPRDVSGVVLGTCDIHSTVTRDRGSWPVYPHM